MPSLEEPESTRPPLPSKASHHRKHSSHSRYARSILMRNLPVHPADSNAESQSESSNSSKRSSIHSHDDVSKVPPQGGHGKDLPVRAMATINGRGVGPALSDTPLPSAPGSPGITPLRHGSASSTPRIKPTTLDIPGLTKSKVSPDGRIAQRDVGSKLLIVMVGLPARGKSYITKKMARYMNWLQHDTKIFNVGERRRVAAGGTPHRAPSSPGKHSFGPSGSIDAVVSSAPEGPEATPRDAARILINGPTPNHTPTSGLPVLHLPEAAHNHNVRNGTETPDRLSPPSSPSKADAENMEQSAEFFDPTNKRAAQIREQCAMDTLDECLDYILEQGGSIGILDATNSTLQRRQTIMDHVRQRAGAELNVLFVESICKDQTLLESNMRLKLSGPDYKDKDPVVALEDFKKRVAIYEKNYVPLGDYEESNNMAYVKMIDVGRKVISHQIKGFLSSQAVYYLLNFNLAPRQIWITRHGESMDNVNGKIGGDSELSVNGRKYARALASFIDHERKLWEIREMDRAQNTHFPPHPGDHTPPNPHYDPGTHDETGFHKEFCVWTSMLKRSIQSAEAFDEENYELKQMRMLDEINAGIMEGMTYEEIRSKYADEYELRRRDKLQYRYPGPGGESYLDVTNRLRNVVVELERMHEHCLLITHRSVARVLLAYFRGLRRDQVADLDCPLGMLYMLEPKPYGVEFKAYRYNAETEWFEHLPNFELQREVKPF